MQVEIRAVCPSAARYSFSCSGDPRRLSATLSLGVNYRSVLWDCWIAQDGAMRNRYSWPWKRGIVYVIVRVLTWAYNARAVAARLCSLPPQPACRVMCDLEPGRWIDSGDRSNSMR